MDLRNRLRATNKRVRHSQELRDEAADEIDRLESLLGQVWDAGRDNNLSWQARIGKIMSTIRENPNKEKKNETNSI